jgi:cytochrome oxidase Cu insertion factor (SCO1/SenC/PrrC family)
VDGKLNHSTRFVLIDRKRRIRAFYVTGEENVLARVRADIRSLLERQS